MADQLRMLAGITIKCLESKDVCFLAQQLTLMTVELTEIGQEMVDAENLNSQQQTEYVKDFVNHHPIIRVLAHKIRNLTCPSLDISFRQSEIAVQRMAGALDED